MRCAIVAVLAASFVLAGCEADATGPESYLSFSTRPDSITQDTDIADQFVIWYSFWGDDYKPAILAIRRGVWARYAPDGWVPCSGCERKYWEELPPWITILASPHEDHHAAVDEYIRSVGDIALFSKVVGTDGLAYYVVHIKLDRGGIFEMDDTSNRIPASAPFIDVLQEYRSRDDLFEHVYPSGFPVIGD